ncbi:fimbrial protein [Providencia vermicola]|uniref:fimbrial protein n=1 Tax=Providencia TaxID=586 RepID=UPI001CEDA9C4|nr:MULTISPECIES: fimbrial protein [Providencia]USR64595.1 type 1 fimbrial protein [Providencia stuartii]HEC8326866.1 type 1 fimbrial protein [Providencia rettgeri]HEM8292271.1 type 1 fimbrial protein [Providencia stuartii]
MNHFGTIVMVLSGIMFAPIVSAQNQISRAQGPFEGTVTMGGSIIETPCAIDADSRDQSVSITTVPVSQIIHDRESPVRNFSIRLINCVLTPVTPGTPNWQTFNITFDGPTDGRNFDVFGHANGLSVKISDADGNVAIPGKAMPDLPIKAGETTLHYNVRVVPNNKRLKPGNYQTTIRFKMDYY